MTDSEGDSRGEINTAAQFLKLQNSSKIVIPLEEVGSVPCELVQAT